MRAYVRCAGWCSTIIGPHVFIGKGAIIRPGLHLENVVVWPGAIVERSVENEVILPD